MAKKQAKKKGSTGGKAGRAPSFEPKVQLFNQFNGCNFQLSPRDFVWESGENDQSDMMMNYLVLQNNARVTDNKTIETRQNITTLFTAPTGVNFTDVCTLIEGELFIATSDKKVRYGKLGESLSGQVEILDIDGTTRDNTWTYLGYADDKLVGMTKGLQLWTGSLDGHTLQNAKHVPDPPSLNFDQLKVAGSLKISSVMNEECPFRITLRYTNLNKYGPTLPSAPLTFYASKPTTEWSGAAYLSILGSSPVGYNIVAVELYYTEDEYNEPSFLARVDLSGGDGGGWQYNWTGYLFDTSMWTISNLQIPRQNYTSGVPASKMVQHDGRLYFWGGDPGYRVWIGGNPGNLFSVSTGVGGGFCDVEPGTGQEVTSVLKYKTDRGATIVTMLCDNKNSSKEHRFNLIENNITLSNEQSTKGWQTEKINGTVGCKSPYGAGVWADGLYAVSRYGLAITTMAMEYNSQLRVTYASSPIEPVFLQQYGNQLTGSVLLCVNEILYMTFGKPNGELDNIIFCYDINLKTWWSYSLDVDEPILNMINIDHEANREGIGIITSKHVYLLPTTKLTPHDDLPTFNVLLETGELGSTQPLQNNIHVTQLEFRFDYFIGDLEIEMKCIDQLGRKITTTKMISYSTVQHNLSEYMRIDLKVESYKLKFHGKANFRLTHWIAKTYPMSNRVGIVWGFDDKQSHTGNGDIHHYFRSYNDIKDAIIP